MIYKSKYQSQKLYDVLKQTLGEDKLYGQVPEDTVIRDTKVCVMTTSGTAESGIAIGNYTRQNEDEHWYKFMCGDRWQVWEAAGASTAAPPYFRKFRRTDTMGTDLEYVDGALYFNNPVRIAYNERRFLWPDVADHPPDIVLSLGTGKDGSTMDKFIQGTEWLYRGYGGTRTLCSPDAKITRLRKQVAAKRGKSKKKKSIVKDLFKALVSLLFSLRKSSNGIRQTCLTVFWTPSASTSCLKQIDRSRVSLTDAFG